LKRVLLLASPLAGMMMNSIQVFAYRCQAILRKYRPVAKLLIILLKNIVYLEGILHFRRWKPWKLGVNHPTIGILSNMLTWAMLVKMLLVCTERKHSATCCANIAQHVAK
jgi:hypothetical protein